MHFDAETVHFISETKDKEKLKTKPSKFLAQKKRRPHSGYIVKAKLINTVRRRARRTFSTHFEIFRRRFDGVVIFQFRLQIFRRRVGIFSHFYLCCSYFFLKGHVNFSSVFSKREL